MRRGRDLRCGDRFGPCRGKIIACRQFETILTINKTKENEMKKRNGRYMAEVGCIAAFYTVLALLGRPLASGVIQLRLAEALCVLPVFLAAGVPGITLGCFLTNILLVCPLPDVLFGTLATLLGAVGTRLLRRHRLAALLPPIFANALILPFVFRYAYGFAGELWYFAAAVGIGELLSAGVLGWGAGRILDKNKQLFSGRSKDETD